MQMLQFLGKGYTRKQLPFYEAAPVDLDDPRERQRMRMKFRATLPPEMRMYAGTH